MRLHFNEDALGLLFALDVFKAADENVYFSGLTLAL